MGVTVKKCHRIMSGNDCSNRVCFSCCWKADNDLADVTLSGSLFQNRAAATGNARPPTVDSLNGGICRRFDPAERTGVLVDQARRRYGLANWGSVVSLHAGLCMSELWSIDPCRGPGAGIILAGLAWITSLISRRYHQLRYRDITSLSVFWASLR